jgi:hypothetical protein
MDEWRDGSETGEFSVGLMDGWFGWMGLVMMMNMMD